METERPDGIEDEPELSKDEREEAMARLRLLGDRGANGADWRRMKRGYYLGEFTGKKIQVDRGLSGWWWWAVLSPRGGCGRALTLACAKKMAERAAQGAGAADD